LQAHRQSPNLICRLVSFSSVEVGCSVHLGEWSLSTDHKNSSFQAVLKDPSPDGRSKRPRALLEKRQGGPIEIRDCLLHLQSCSLLIDFRPTNPHLIYELFEWILFKELEAAYFQGFPDAPLPRMNQYVQIHHEADKTTATDFWTSYLAMRHDALARRRRDGTVISEK